MSASRTAPTHASDHPRGAPTGSGLRAALEADAHDLYALTHEPRPNAREINRLFKSLAERLVDAITGGEVDLCGEAEVRLTEILQQSSCPSSIKQRLIALREVARIGARSRRAPEHLPAPGSRSFIFLAALEHGHSVASQSLREVFTSPSVVSHVGGELEREGLVQKERIGRSVSWRITPRGRQAIGRARQEGADARVTVEPIARGASDVSRQFKSAIADLSVLLQSASSAGAAESGLALDVGRGPVDVLVQPTTGDGPRVRVIFDGLGDSALVRDASASGGEVVVHVGCKD